MSVIKYLGSKRRLVPQLVAIARAIPGARTALDLFTGTTRVAQGLKAAGMEVTANDLASYSAVFGEQSMVDSIVELIGSFRGR